jgi:hypothetical protein
MSQPKPSKFTGALAALRNPPAEAETEQPPAEPVDTVAPSRGKGRPPGKRSDPAFQPTTVFLRKHTKNAAQRRLLDRTDGQDLSDLLEQLLAEWVATH